MQFVSFFVVAMVRRTWKPKEISKIQFTWKLPKSHYILESNPVHFSWFWPMWWSHSAKSKNTSGQWVPEGVCQISNLKSKKWKSFEMICKTIYDDDDDDNDWWWLLIIANDDCWWWWLLMMTVVDDDSWWQGGRAKNN